MYIKKILKFNSVDLFFIIFTILSRFNNNYMQQRQQFILIAFK